jgi:predicted RNase H-like nuclease
MQMQAIFTGFDSAWSANNKGAIANLVLLEDGSLQVAGELAPVLWERAIDRARQHFDVDLHVWAIDQPLCVPNETGCRPVDADLGRALMANFGCAAHAANRQNFCFAENAPIWTFLRTLEANAFLHSPMQVPEAKCGRYYFECYPHPALLGLFDLDHILKYKAAKGRTDEWQRLIGLLRSLIDAELPIRNIKAYVPDDLLQNKSNEDRLDALISAYVAAYWWRFGAGRSTLIGDPSTGYIVTPHSARTFAAFDAYFMAA